MPRAEPFEGRNRADGHARGCRARGARALEHELVASHHRAIAGDIAFAGIVIHGGGVRPSPDDCPAQKARVVFLVGDRNPLHGNGLVLRDHYRRCGNDLTFHLLAGAEHDGEWKALGEKGGAILDELATARMARATPVVVAATRAATLATSSSSPAPSIEPAPVPGPAVQVPPRAGCGCDAGRPRVGAVALIVPGLLLLVRRRR